MTMDKGVLYIATGNTYVKECESSALSLHKLNPNLPVALMTSSSQVVDNINGVFDYVIKSNFDKFTWLDEIAGLMQTPFEQTLYLDSDTYICNDLTDLFLLTKQFDIAVAHAPLRQSHGKNILTVEIPDSFPELNTGVILFRLNKAILALFERWRDILLTQLDTWTSPVHDQPAFRQAMWEMSKKVNSTILTPEYNCRFIRPGFLHQTANILHGRDKYLSKIASFLNKSQRQRVHVPGIRGLELHEQQQAIPSSTQCNLLADVDDDRIGDSNNALIKDPQGNNYFPP